MLLHLDEFGVREVHAKLGSRIVDTESAPTVQLLRQVEPRQPPYLREDDNLSLVALACAGEVAIVPANTTARCTRAPPLASDPSRATSSR